MPFLSNLKTAGNLTDLLTLIRSMLIDMSSTTKLNSTAHIELGGRLLKIHIFSDPNESKNDITIRIRMK